MKYTHFIFKGWFWNTYMHNESHADHVQEKKFMINWNLFICLFFKRLINFRFVLNNNSTIFFNTRNTNMLNLYLISLNYWNHTFFLVVLGEISVWVSPPSVAQLHQYRAHKRFYFIINTPVNNITIEILQISLLRLWSTTKLKWKMCKFIRAQI